MALHTVVESPSYLAAAKDAGMSDAVRVEVVSIVAADPMKGQRDMTKAFDKIMAGFDDAERFIHGDRDGFLVHVPDEVDVKAIREGLNLSQPGFAKSFGLSVGRLRDWEQKRSPIDAPARAFLTVLQFEPEAVFRAMARAAASPAKARRSAKSPTRQRALARRAS